MHVCSTRIRSCSADSEMRSCKTDQPFPRTCCHSKRPQIDKTLTQPPLRHSRGCSAFVHLVGSAALAANQRHHCIQPVLRTQPYKHANHANEYTDGAAINITRPHQPHPTTPTHARTHTHTCTHTHAHTSRLNPTHTYPMPPPLSSGQGPCTPPRRRAR